MIGRLTGTIVDCAPGALVVDVGGVGYSVRIPLSTYYVVSGRSNGAVSLHVHTHVRDDAIVLFGFATPDERTAFERLIAISGVGPTMALAVLSGIGASDLDRAVLDGDRDRLQRIPGIGRKTADRILLELRDRLERDHRTTDRRAPDGSVRENAASALVNLGYSREAAGKAVDSAISSARGGADADLEGVLKAALRSLVP